MAYDAGVIGLGIMGSAMAGNLLAAGMSVFGHDPDDTAMAGFEAIGGVIAAGAAGVAAGAPVVLLSLPSDEALRAVTSDICQKPAQSCILVECSTLAIEDKIASRDALAGNGMTLLDCPLSGTGAQAAAGDLVVLASGDRQAVQQCHPIFDAISRATHFLGEFGNGMKMKYIANLLVAIHNASAAEALVLARMSGLDPQQTYDVIRDGAGTSRMFEIRGPMMVQQSYAPPTMKLDVWAKDVGLITAFAADLQCPTPLFDLSGTFYEQARAHGMGGEDTAAIKRIFEMAAGLDDES